MEAIKVKSSQMLRSKEFAKMLFNLHENKLVDSHIRDYVSKWIVTLLMSENSSRAKGFPVIKKKIRDEILDTPTEYVRRSSFYMVIKVLLQHNLTLELGEHLGKLLYKIIMLKFITDQCDLFNRQSIQFSNIELVTQALAKLARRIEKLSTNSDSLKELSERIISNACNVIHETRLNIDKQIEKMQTIDERQSKLPPLKNLDFEADINQTVETLRKYLRQPMIEPNNNSSNDMLNIKTYKRFQNKHIDLRQFHKCSDVIQLNLAISDFEHQILYRTNIENFDSKPHELRTFCIAYIQCAERFYGNDPLGHSKMVLVLLKMLAMLDEIATKAYPMLLEHRSGINPNIINSLLLPSFSDMKIAHELEMYFRKRNKKAKFPSLIEESEVTPQSFSARLDVQDEQMRINLLHIETIDDRNIKNTELAWEEGRRDVQNWCNERALHNNHIYDTITYTERIHDPNCELCSIMKKIENMKKMGQNVQDLKKIAPKGHQYKLVEREEVQHSYERCKRCFLNRKIRKMRIAVYECLLPIDEYKRNAIIFELKVPGQVACLRDCLHSFNKYATDRCGEHLYVQRNWTDFLRNNVKGFVFNKELDFDTVHQYLNTSNSLNNNNTLCNDIQLGSIQATEHFEKELHVDEHFLNFVVPNKYDCIFHSSGFELVNDMTDSSITRRCTLSGEKFSKYKELQWTIKGTTHTQNEVLARQSECSHELSLVEFKNFGSLRADGHRLQWRKLYAMIEAEALSFENESVMSLIMQTIWETGISGDVGNIRESHEDLQCIKFTRVMIQLLNKFTEQQKHNWGQPLKLLMVVLIAVRIFEVNEDESLIAKVIVLLDKLRTIAINWIETNQKAIQAIKKSDQSNQIKLRKNLTIIAIAGAVTFNVHPQHKFFERIFSNNTTNGFSAFRMWLQFIVTLNSNIILKDRQKEQNIRLLLRLIRNIGIHIEPTLQKLIKLNFNDLYDFVKSMWTRSKNATFIGFNSHPECNQVLVIKVMHPTLRFNHRQVKTVTIDLITGSFLVDNLPICRLPDEITGTNLFKRVFEDFVFEVQPDANDSFFSVHKYNGNSYGFLTTMKGIIIIEQQANGTDFELIPPEVLNGEIPPLLIENYSHWLNKRDKQIDFRPKLFSDKDFSTEVKYQLDLKTNRLLHKKTKRNMLNINSQSYNSIVGQLSRLEQQKYIHILMDEPKIAKIELVRMQLKFKVDCTTDRTEGYDLLSNEFSNMRVSIQQKCGTLFGLKRGLILEEANTYLPHTKMLLLPHGKIDTELRGSYASVNIDLKSDLRTPSWHLYKVDGFCRQLKPISGTYSAWFYLAYLHAVTSHGQIEPFTGMSGTERALQILQSNFVWSSSPYDDETIKMLQMFEKLTPCRRLNETMMTVEWPSFVHSHSAQDSYIFIVKKLLNDSERLTGLYPDPDKIKKQKSKDADLSLNAHAHFRNLSFTPNLRVSDEYLTKFIKQKDQKTTFPKTPDINFSKNTQHVAILSNNREYCVPPDLTTSLRKFFTFQNDELPGTVHIEAVENTLNNIQEVRDNPTLLRERWISFYHVIRNSLLKPQAIAIILSLFAHHENNIDAILVLQAIAMNRKEFTHIDPPNIETIPINVGEYSEKKVSECLKNSHEPNFQQDWSFEKKDKYIQTIKDNILELTTIVTEAWPCATVTLTNYPQYSLDIDVSSANKNINSLLKKWYDYHLLNQFIDEVVSKLNSLPSPTSINCPYIDANVGKISAKRWSKYNIDWKYKINQNLDEHNATVEEARMVWTTSCTDSERSAADWWSIYDTIMSHKSQHLIDAGIFPRLVPTLILPKLISDKTDKKLKMVIGAWAISIANEQRFNRISMLWKQPHQKQTLQRELETTPHENWKPSDYPEWLLFEIEQNVTIRYIQIKIAKRMIDDNSSVRKKKHFTMQFNMGEGKTAVIVPILTSVLANGQQACQITVLKSLFATNLKSLRQYLGGMLGRRVYSFPCRRDLPVSKYIEEIHNMYEECKKNKGIFPTLNSEISS